ncbi:hypothetical protein SCHPADRAFT_942154 [Schizopora paradoxa]|uniref:F-box domain-containing protein n=1 Tax=Schizopora paradoxa TaxID=27342 RepID=A0A0H2RI52_9AGAM|nr:hypothetical protein SCHPADRAFT_942154 [Schizopora paradoxa]
MSNDNPHSDAPNPPAAPKDAGEERATFPYDDEEQLIVTRETDLLNQWIKEQGPPELATLEYRSRLWERAAGLKDSLKVLEAKRRGPHTWNDVREVARFRASWKTILWRIFPINELPPEILVTIFTMAILSHSSKEVTRSRLAVAGVCKQWRRVVHESPTMWSIIEFKTKPPFTDSVQALRRSKNAPLILLVDVRDPKWSTREADCSYTPSDMTALMSHIVPVMDRVTELYILCDTWKVVLAAIMQLRDVKAPALSRFEVLRSGKAYVSFERNGMPQELNRPIPLFRGGAPRLNHVSLDGVHVDWIRTPLKDIRTLEMRKMAMEVMPNLKIFRKMLLDSSGLRTLTLEGAGPQWVDEEADGWIPVEFPCLESLTLGDFAVDYGTFIIRLFNAPKLRRLTLCLLEEDCSALFAKMTNMFPDLTVLFLFDVGVKDDETTRKFFLSIPKLRYFKTMRMERDVFALLLQRVPKYPLNNATKQEETEVPPPTELVPLCPRIETAECGNGVTSDIALDFVASRAEMGLPLRRLLLPVTYFRSLEKEVSDVLRNTGILSLIPPGSRPELDVRYASD